MKAIVCVKQVPDTSGVVAVKADGTMDRAAMATTSNPDDMNALEAALKMKDATGCKVVVVTMGPPPAAGMLREALAIEPDNHNVLLALGYWLLQTDSDEAAALLRRAYTIRPTPYLEQTLQKISKQQ